MSKVNILSGEFDAEVWTEEWLKIIKENSSIPTDKGTMIGWFANAIMAGYDRAYQEMEEKQKITGKCIGIVERPDLIIGEE